MPKSGTTSLATMFAPVARTRHEYAMTEAARVRLGQASGTITADEARKWLLERDALCNAEIDSTSFLWTWASDLPGLFPRARFVATMRDPHSWCRSLAGMLLHMGDVSEEHLAWGGLIDAGDHGRRPLEEPELFARAALAYWRTSITAIMGLPPDRTWWCRTDLLTARAVELADWVGVDPALLDLGPANTARVAPSAVTAALPDAVIEAQITASDIRIWRHAATRGA